MHAYWVSDDSIAGSHPVRNPVESSYSAVCDHSHNDKLSGVVNSKPKADLEARVGIEPALGIETA